MIDKSAYPWGEYLGPDDRITKQTTYKNGLYIPLFEKRLFPAVEEAVGDLSYYVYDPVAHGADPAGRYPLLYWFHGAGNAMAGDNVLPYSGAERFASPEFQRLMGGAYIVCPVANERVNDAGTLAGTWLTARPGGARPEYDPALIERIRPYFPEGTFLDEFLGGDCLYAPTLKALLDGVRATYAAIDQVIVAGTSAGGYAAWRFILDYPQAVDACLLMAGAYLPAPSELDALDKAGLPIWIVHARHDEIIRYDVVIEPILTRLRTMANVRLTLLPFARHGDHGVASNFVGHEIGQHCVCAQVAQNMIYDDGTPYDPAFPEGVTGWVRSLRARAKW